MKKLIALLFVLALVGAACGSSTATGSADTDSDDETTTTEAAVEEDDVMEETSDCDAVKTAGQLTVATGDPVFPPWILDDDPAGGEGFESAVVYAVAGELGLDVAWVRTTFDQGVAPGAKDYDFNVQQFSITDARDEVVDFSSPYYVAKQAIIATEPAKFDAVTSVDDLKTLKLGAGIATTSLDYIETVIQPDSPASVFDDNVAAKAAFDAGQIDGLVLDLPTAYFVSAVEIDGAFIVGVLPEVSADADALGFVFEEGSALVPCVNDALAALTDSGKLGEIENQYLNQSGDIPVLEG